MPTLDEVMRGNCGNGMDAARPRLGARLWRAAPPAAILLGLILIPAAQGRFQSSVAYARGASSGEIVFTGTQVGVTSTPVMLMEADGSGRRTLFTLPGSNPVEPTWRPNGGAFTYTERGALWEANADGSHRHEIYKKTGVLSPDGSKIAVRGGPGGVYAIVVDLRSGATHMTRDWFNPITWESNDTLLAFHENTDGESGLAGGVYELSTDAVRGRLWSDRVDQHISWSRGHSVAVGTGGGQPVVLRGDGSNARPLPFRGSGIDVVQTISISPDGSHVVYAGYDSTAPYPAENEVVVSEIGGSGAKVLGPGAEPNWRPVAAGSGSGSSTGTAKTGGSSSTKLGPCKPRAVVGVLVLVGTCVQRAGGSYVSAKPVRIDGLDFVPRSGELTASAHRLTGDVSIMVAGDETYRGRLDVDPTLQPALTPFGSSSVGGLPLAAVSIAFDGSHGGRAQVHLDLELPFFHTEGSAEVGASTAAGSSLNGVDVSVPGGTLAGTPVNGAELRYQRKDDSGRSVWSVQVELPIFGLDAERGLVLGGSLVDGELGTLTLGLSTPNKPLGETGLFVQEGDVTLGLHPFGIALHGAFTLGPVPPSSTHVPALAELDGTGSIFHDSACDPDSGRAFARLVLSVDAFKILGFTAGQAKVCATTNGFVSFAADTHLNLYAVGIAGMFQGQANTHAFQATGSVAIAIPGHTWRGDGVVSDVGFGGCATLLTLKKPKHWYDPSHWVNVPIRAGGGSSWNGHDRHTFFGSGCGWDRWSSRAFAMRQPSSAQRISLTVPRGTEAPAFVFDGSAAAPVVSLTGPDGSTITTPSGGDPFIQTDTYVAFRDDVEHSTYVALLAPQPGQWTAATAPGSPPVVATQESRALPAPRVSATVTGRGAVRTLRWKLSAQPGLRVRFSEQNFGALRTIATVSSPRGSLRFRPAPAGGRRRLVALFLQNGEPRGLVELQSFTPPRLVRPGKATRIRLHRTRSSVLMRWRGATGAASYRIVVRIGQRSVAYFSRGTRIAIQDVRSTQTIVIRLTAVSARGLTGPTVSKHLRVR